MKVLVIDDEKEIREVVEDYLQEQGYEVVTAEKGKPGLELAVNEHPDLILLDVGLPDMEGYDVCKKMREDSNLIHTPIIMLTARTEESDELSGFNAGADDYVAKPFKPARLLARIQSAISRSHRELNANALTHLPGNVAIGEEIQKKIASQEPFSILYIDLNSFKAFNDRYGFMRGDDAILLTAKVLGDTLANWEDQKIFLGHVGGDDFIAVLDSHEVAGLCKDILRRFDKQILSLYDEEDRKRGGIISINRKGEQVRVPIMGMAIAVVTNLHKKFNHPGEIAFIAGDLKKWVKSESRSAFLIDRRT